MFSGRYREMLPSNILGGPETVAGLQPHCDFGRVPRRIHHPQITAATPGVQTSLDCRVVGAKARLRIRHLQQAAEE